MKRPSGHDLALLLPVAGLALGLLGWAGARAARRDDAAVATAQAALAHGNRLVRDGRPTDALAAYAAGWAEGRGGAADGLLAYNLAVTAHRLGRLPEALLWYRRADRLRPDDPWLAENLELVRAEVGAPRLPAPGPAGALATHRWAPAAAAAVAAWTALALLLVRRRLTRRLSRPWAAEAWVLPAAAALALWLAGPTLLARAPRAAVLTAPCGGGGARYEAGSELWVRPAGEGWAVAGGPPGLVCPPAAVGLVGPGG